MKPSKQAKVAAAITQSKGKMYEYQVPLEDHIELPKRFPLEELFPLAIGTLGDFAAAIVRKHLQLDNDADLTEKEELQFAATVMYAYDESQLNPDLSCELLLLGASAFYLSEMPGNASVLCKRLIDDPVPDDELADAVCWALVEPWAIERPTVNNPHLAELLQVLRGHFITGNSEATARVQFFALRNWMYANGSPHELLLADVFEAVVAQRIARSAWSLLPIYSEMGAEQWRPYLERAHSIKELWPSQRMIGVAGLYRGNSAIVQMPTSAGKTRATELVIRSAFLSQRTTLAVVVAPFRALVQEIANSLRNAFAEDGYQVNQLSDVLQPDYISELAGLLGIDHASTPHVVVLTPEKLLYVLRQLPDLVNRIGLIIYDEGHQFDTGSRGVTYELLLTSIKRLLNDNSQSVLISAVIQNASALAAWLLKDESRVVADSSLQTQRALAFTSWPKRKLGQLSFREKPGGEELFFVPRILVAENLPLRRGERAPRIFPLQTNSRSIALYLALKLVTNGGVAIFTGTKLSAAKIVREAAEEVFSRGISMDAPSKLCDQVELTRLTYLYRQNFGDHSYLTKAAALGIFAHHGDTPHGLRLAIEHAMRDGLIGLVVCTSTLAQGVNLPIRYLLVTGTQQGQDKIKVRDFHNLMGRAGRAGMHGEGTVIFTDPSLFDDRLKTPWRWNSVQDLLLPEKTEPTGSTLLELVRPLYNDHNNDFIKTSPVTIVKKLLHEREKMFEIASKPSKNYRDRGFSAASLVKQLLFKCEVLDAIQSFLMSYREDTAPETFYDKAATLAKETLAYHLGDDADRTHLVDVFIEVAKHIEGAVPDINRQARFGRTLLGVNDALAIDEWVTANVEQLSASIGEEGLFEVLWPLLTKLAPEARLKDTEPLEAIYQLACFWIAGKPYGSLYDGLNAVDARYPHGEQRRAFTIDMVVELCEQTLGFEFTLLLAAITEAISQVIGEEKEKERLVGLINTLQKRLKYGLPTRSSIAFFEAGFAERVVAQEVDVALLSIATNTSSARALVKKSASKVRAVIDCYPAYFHSVFASMTR
jgi:superfamily II DNA/RNA helicase